MSVEFYRGSPGKFDSRTLNRKTLNRWTGRKNIVSFSGSPFSDPPLGDADTSQGERATGALLGGISKTVGGDY